MTTQSAIANVIDSVTKQADSGGLSSRVVSAIRSAANKTGVDFSYLLQKAAQESGFDPSAKATTSSAIGLFQFTSQTWLQMVKTSGAQYGLGAYATQISSDQNGHLSVADPTARQAILALRNDPQVSAEMAGELDKLNAASLRQSVGGKIENTDLYLAHFLGASGASDFLNSMHTNSSASGAALLPDAAAANPSIFYTKTGEARSLGEIYQRFAQKFDGSMQVASSLAATSKASATTADSSGSMGVAAYSGTNVAYSNTSSSFFKGANSQNITASGPSTLFTAMLLGQMNGEALAGSSARSAFGDQADKKKNAMAVLSAVA